VLPAGTEKIGKFEWNVTLNASPTIVDRLNELPVDGTVIYVRDVAYAHEGSPPHRLNPHSLDDALISATVAAIQI
jgi:hypothetical protein